MSLLPYPAHPIPGALPSHVDLEHVQTISEDILFADDAGKVLCNDDVLKLSLES